MKKTINILTIASIIAIVSLSAFSDEKDGRPKRNVKDTCSEWLSISSNYIQMQWCKDEFGEVNYKFRNGYKVPVHFWFKFECKDGRVHTGNMTLDAGAISDGADMMKSVPNMWYILKKQHQDSDGKWVAF